MSKKIAIVLNAGNDTNGNPRRAVLLFNTEGAFIKAVDEGYAGQRGALKELGAPDAVVIATFPTTTAEYKAALKQYKR